MKRLKTMIKLRPDWFYCPLPLGCDSYGNCYYECPMCFCRDLDERIWKIPFRPGSFEAFKKEFKKWNKTKLPIKLGNKSDPYPPIEKSERITRRILEELSDIDYPTLVNTRGTGFLRDLDLIDNLFVGMLMTSNL